MFKLPYSHFTCQQGHAQNTSSQASAVFEPRTSRCINWVSKRTRDQIASIHWITEKARKFQKNISFFFTDYAKTFVWITTNCGNFSKEMAVSNHLTWLLRKLCAWQEATVRTGCETIDWFKIGKGMDQGCILSPYLFNL